MNRDALVVLIIVGTLGTEYLMSLGMIGITDTCSLNNAENIILIELKMANLWDILLE